MERCPDPSRWVDKTQDIGRRALANFGKTFCSILDVISYENNDDYFRGAAAELDRKLYDNTNIQNRWDSLINREE